MLIPVFLPGEATLCIYAKPRDSVNRLYEESNHIPQYSTCSTNIR
jgi:hypothetical protein